MAARRQFRAEMCAVLGSFSPEDGILLAAPARLGDTPEEFVLTHESLHRLLTLGTLFGFFERQASLACRQTHCSGNAGLYGNLREVMARALEDSFATHEGVASYVELCRCAQNHDDVEEHCRQFPSEYVEALTPIVDLLGLPRPASPLQPYQWATAVMMAKVALNGPVLRAFTDPSTLTPESFVHFEETHSPDARFVSLCEAIKAKGGLGFLLPRLSENWETGWRKALGTPTQFCDAPGGGQLVDLLSIGGLMYAEGNRVAELAEYDIMRLIASCATGLEVAVGAEEIEASATPFLTKWRPLLPPESQEEIPASGRVEVTPPGDSRHRSRARTYRVRFCLKNVTSTIGLDDLRAFLREQSGGGMECVAGFLETTERDVAVFAASLAGFDRTDARAKDGVRVQDAIVGIMPILEVLDFALLAHQKEEYGERTAWHLPLETAHRYGFPNVAVGIHGALLRSWPFCNPSRIAGVVRQVTEKGETVFIRSVNLTKSSGTKTVFDMGTFRLTAIDESSKSIVLQAFSNNLGWFERLPCSPDFTAWLGTVHDLQDLHGKLAGQRNVQWGDPTRDACPGLLKTLIDVAYDLDQSCVRDVFGDDLVPVDNPWEHD